MHSHQIFPAAVCKWKLMKIIIIIYFFQLPNATLASSCVQVRETCCVWGVSHSSTLGSLVQFHVYTMFNYAAVVLWPRWGQLSISQPPCHVVPVCTASSPYRPAVCLWCRTSLLCFPQILVNNLEQLLRMTYETPCEFRVIRHCHPL